MLLIGDVHGHLDRFQAKLGDAPASIQLGDFGFRYQHEWHLKNHDPAYHRVLFGNHDYYPGLHWAHSLGNHAHLPEHSLFAIRGADSIDRHVRKEGFNWWREEELSYLEGYAALDAYEAARPEVVISHDGPASVVAAWYGIHDKSSTRHLLQVMLEAHHPRLWVFGHHHRSRTEERDGTTFRCLAELEIMEL